MGADTAVDSTSSRRRSRIHLTARSLVLSARSLSTPAPVSVAWRSRLLWRRPRSGRSARALTAGRCVWVGAGKEGGELMPRLRDPLRSRLFTSRTSSPLPMVSSARACAPSLGTTLASLSRSRLWIRSSTGASPPSFASRLPAEPPRAASSGNLRSSAFSAAPTFTVTSSRAFAFLSPRLEQG